MIILALAVLAFGIYSYSKESKVTGIYKSANVYGRIYAYITTTALYGAVACLIGGIAFVTMLEDAAFGEILGSIAAGIGGCALWGAIGFFLYKRAYNRCPEALRKRLLISMMITGFGTAVKILLFILPGVWNLVGPDEMVGANGEKLYLYHGEVYDSSWNHVGTASADRTSYIKKN